MPFGPLTRPGVYDFYVNRPRLFRAIGAVVWGVDVRPTYRAMAGALREVPDGSLVVDVPCGSGVALRGLGPHRRLRYLGVDRSPQMLALMRRRAARRGLTQVELVDGDMLALPVGDLSADLILHFNGLHVTHDPPAAVRDALRSLRPGGRIVGSMLLSGAGRRQDLLLARARRQGRFGPGGTAEDLRGWFEAAGARDVRIAGGGGLAVFSAAKRN